MDKEFAEDSDSSDEDYVPGGKPEEIVSEEDSDAAVEEDALSDTETCSKRKKRTKNPRKKLKTNEEGLETGIKPTENTELSEEEKKKKVDELWADFLQDTNFKPKTKQETTVSSKPRTVEPPKTTEKVKITEIFEFAGEEVKVEKEVPKNSIEARLSGTSSSKPKKTGSLSGIGNVLSQLGKKKKISILEKTKLDWDRFKKDENIEEELTSHNKGKDGYLERQDFLERADLRRFEIEKEIRAVERNKRMNMGSGDI